MSKYNRFTSSRGHSDRAPGASGNGYKEHVEATKFNAEYISQMRAVGKTVTDTTSNATNASAVVNAQWKAANAAGVGADKLDMAWHLNAASEETATGVEVCYKTPAEKAIAQEIAKAISNVTGLKLRRDGGAYQRDDLGFLNWTKSPAVLIELGFITNKNDMFVLISKRKEIVAAIVKVLVGTAPSVKPVAPKPATAASSPYARKKLVSKTGGLRFYSKGSWADKDVVGTVGKGLGFPTVLAKVNVAGSYQYKVQNSKGKTFYITASEKYVELKNK
ncbi:hypothetical protein HCA69_02215 [Listeria grandensis]|uniref:MurNAc-LAA domain-containing protein n=1 Tax=Listeria grandensis TaxID=1494963 RepID=A0A7X0Y200_9LIST|nr:N-acetylmuramoyl-L-alanine amidase [Listeria grandensis]MBC1935164.1 hypothetical protein [Listeria grandensis]